MMAQGFPGEGLRVNGTREAAREMIKADASALSSSGAPSWTDHGWKGWDAVHSRYPDGGESRRIP